MTWVYVLLTLRIRSIVCVCCTLAKVAIIFCLHVEAISRPKSNGDPLEVFLQIRLISNAKELILERERDKTETNLTNTFTYLYISETFRLL